MPKRKCNIWRVATYDTAFAFFYFGTKREAEAFIRKAKKEEGEQEIQLDPINVELTRFGVARALQDLIDFTCFNEH